MTIIVREERILAGKKYENVKVYKSGWDLIRKADKEEADKIDNFIENKMREIEKELDKNGLLKLKGKKGEVIKLWYEVGVKLKFTEGLKLSAEDKKLLWRALYDHAGKLAPGPISDRAKKTPERSHFSYCFKVAQFPWNFVKSAGDWSAWTEFFDSEIIRNDKRILEWLSEKQNKEFNNISSLRDWIRPLAKSIRNELKGKDTSVYSDEELKTKLEIAFSKAFKQS